MKIIRNIQDWHAYRTLLPKGASVGFVPTMGCLHPGHQSLIKSAVTQNDYCVLSIFINPTQFNEASDYDSYPRSQQKDCDMAKTGGVDCVFMPEVSEIYPPVSKHFQLHTRHPATMILEGLYRPGHFDGVMSVILRLLLLVKAKKAYFGEKDYQQYVIIKDLAQAFCMDTEVVPCPTIRTTEGLPYSSRNLRLSPIQLKRAHRFAHIFHTEHKAHTIAARLTQAGIAFDYVDTYCNRLFAAVWIDDVRLIDNRPKVQ